MAPPIITLADFKAGKRGKLVILQVYVHTRLDEHSFLVCDNTDHATFSVHKDPSLGKNVGVGRYLRLVKPTYEKDCLIPHTRPCEVAPFEYKEVDSSSVVTDSTNRMSTFDDIGKLKPHSVVPSVVAKVTYLSPKKKMQGSGRKYRTAGVRDVEGVRNAIKLFEPADEKVEEEGVYRFQNINVEDFKLDTDAHLRLATRSDSGVAKVEAEIAALFEGINEGDGIIKGLILGHEKPYMYLSCPDCRKSVKENSPVCGNVKCKKELKEKVKDFNVVLLLQDTADETQMPRVLCFRRQFKGRIGDVEDMKMLTDELNKLSFTECNVTYTKKEDAEELTAVKLEFNL